MSLISDDDDYSSSSCHSLSYNNKKCNQCNNMIMNQQQPTRQQKKKKKKSNLSRFISIFKRLITPCHCSPRPQVENMRQEEEVCCKCNSNIIPSKSFDSFTVIDDQLPPQQPWIVPSNYHKNMLSDSPDHSKNQWIFRTGWTPQPDPLALIHSGWCSRCGSCVKKDLNQCSSCGIQPLITTRHHHGLNGIDEKELK